MNSRQAVPSSSDRIRQYQARLSGISGTLLKVQGTLSLIERERALKKQAEAEAARQEVASAGTRKVLRKKRK